MVLEIRGEESGVEAWGMPDLSPQRPMASPPLAAAGFLTLWNTLLQLLLALS